MAKLVKKIQRLDEIHFLEPEPQQEYPISTEETIGMRGERLIGCTPFCEETGTTLMKILGTVLGFMTTIFMGIITRSYLLNESLWPIVTIPIVLIICPLSLFIYYLCKMMARIFI